MTTLSPGGIRIRLALLLAYLALPFDLIPDVIAVSVTPTTRSSSSQCYAASCGTPESTRCAPTGLGPTTDLLFSLG